MQVISQTLRDAIDGGKPQRVLLEFANDGQPVSFSNEDISVSAGLRLAEVFSGSEDLAIGQTPSAQISFTLLNDHGQLANFGFGEFTAYLGARIDSGTPPAGAKTKTFLEGGVNRLYEFSPLGVFTAEKPRVIKRSMIEVTAEDRMTLLDEEWPDDLTVTYPITALELLTAICEYLEVPMEAATAEGFLNSDLVLTKKPKQFKNATLREVVGRIAEAACSVARFNRAGELELAWYTQTAKTFDEHDYSEFTPAWFEAGAIDGLHVRNEDATNETVIGTSENPYLIQNNPFLKPT